MKKKVAPAKKGESKKEEMKEIKSMKKVVKK